MDGPQFGEIQPKNNLGQLSGTVINLAAQGLDYGSIVQVTPSGSFRVGQQIWFNLQVQQALESEQSYITSVRLKPWWLVENIEFRPPGSSGGWLDVDEAAFSGGQVFNNRWCWMPSPKRLDITPYQTPAPEASPARNSDSIFLDDVWKIELDDPSNPDWQATLLPGQTRLRRGLSFYYPAHGVALGFTCEIEVGAEQQPITSVGIVLRWKTGATHSHTQEAID